MLLFTKSTIFCFVGFFGFMGLEAQGALAPEQICAAAGSIDCNLIIDKLFKVGEPDQLQSVMFKYLSQYNDKRSCRTCKLDFSSAVPKAVVTYLEAKDALKAGLTPPGLQCPAEPIQMGTSQISVTITGQNTRECDL